jgi:hypothetical protein
MRPNKLRPYLPPITRSNFPNRDSRATGQSSAQPNRNRSSFWITIRQRPLTNRRGTHTKRVCNPLWPPHHLDCLLYGVVRFHFVILGAT